MYESCLFSRHPESVSNYFSWLDEVTQELLAAYPDEPYAGDTPAALAALLDGELLPSAGRSLGELRKQLATVIRKSVAVSHPHTAAHLHTPVVVPALAAEIVISALNQSMDSFDQAPAATVIEELSTVRSRELCSTVGAQSLDIPSSGDKHV